MKKKRWERRLRRKKQTKIVTAGLIFTLMFTLCVPGNLAVAYAEEPENPNTGTEALQADDPGDPETPEAGSSEVSETDADAEQDGETPKVTDADAEQDGETPKVTDADETPSLAQTTATVKFWTSGNEQGLQEGMTTRLNNRKLDEVMIWEKGNETGGKRISFEFDHEITFDTVILTAKTKNGLPKNIIFRYPRNNMVKDANLSDGSLIKLDGTDWDVAEDYKGTDEENKDSYSHEYTMTRLNGKPLTTSYLILQFEAPVSNGGAFEFYGITFKNSQTGDDGGAGEPLDPGSDVGGPEEPAPELPEGEPLKVEDLKAEKVDGGIRISWSAVVGARNYKIWRSSDLQKTDVKKVHEFWEWDTNKKSFEYIDPDGKPTDYYWISAAIFDDNYQQTGETGLSAKWASAEEKGEESPNPENPELPAGEPLENVEMSVERSGGGVKLSWESVDGAYGYHIWRADSAYPQDEYIACVGTRWLDEEEGLTFTDSEGKFSSYYWISALTEAEENPKERSTEDAAEEITVEESGLSTESASLEKETFGDHTLIFSPRDKVETMDDLLKDLFKEQGYEDAQFNGQQWQVYFKPGDYTEARCMYVGFYTSLSGLGKTPYDVKLNNIAVPPCLPNSNATCSFWRSAENFSVLNTGNAAGECGYDVWGKNDLNWAVAQAAPMRRIYSTRKVNYDWCCGWASGGYVADCIFDGVEGGTPSGQQFYTRNSQMKNSTGTTLNNFNQGVIADNLPTVATGDMLSKGNGYSNWGKEGNAGGVITNVETTPKLSEKPFLYLDGDEYMVFIPAVRTNTKGVSWSEDSMGEGTSVSFDTFYVAKPDDTAAVINEQLAAGKNIYFTPGTYYAEEPIRVTNSNTVVLGSGMMSLVPENGEAAMIISDDADNVKIAGIIFDAGTDSETLLKVGEQKGKDHSAAPTVLQDLFFRVGGTSAAATKADKALEINSNDVLGDHFWIWRADHGEGVSWDNTRSKNGLVVNGDNVTCYALFNEHFQEYDTLWNGNNGATYFYQNEKCYDPVSQDTWMSHGGTANGYAAYKVANHVDQHYAVGLGIYNVFIYTGPNRDGMVPMQMDNAIEVPNKAGVLVENACMQTFADDNKALQKFNHIVNGVGESVSSGKPGGYGWNRTFITSYCNGTAEVGLGRGAFNGTKTVRNIKEIPGEDKPDTGDDKPNTGDDKPDTGDGKPGTGENRPNTGTGSSGNNNSGSGSGGSNSQKHDSGSSGSGDSSSGNSRTDAGSTKVENTTTRIVRIVDSNANRAGIGSSVTANEGTGSAEDTNAGVRDLADSGAVNNADTGSAPDSEGLQELQDEETPLANISAADNPVQQSGTGMSAVQMLLLLLAAIVGGAGTSVGLREYDRRKKTSD